VAELAPDHSWLERELAELREREAEYRDRLGRGSAEAARLRAHAESLHMLFRRRPPSKNALLPTLVDVARLSAQALRIRRTSIWLFDRERLHLDCVVQLTPIPARRGCTRVGRACSLLE
jgi:hypothetical protein